MVARIDWLNNGIDRLLSGQSPLTPEQWDVRDSIMVKDIDLLRQAAEFNSLRPGASQPGIDFLARLRDQMTAEASKEDN